jgi:hypothetical protein
MLVPFEGTMSDEVAQLKRINEVLRAELRAARSTERDLGTGNRAPTFVDVNGSIAVAAYADGKIRISKTHTPSEFIVIERADVMDAWRGLRLVLPSGGES